MSVTLPDETVQAWQDREGPLVLTTVNKEGMPNSIYVGIAKLLSDGRIAIADNYFDKTKSNIDSHCQACVLFLSKSRKSYQIKGSIEYHNDGPIYEDMLQWADPKHPRKGVAIMNAESVYRGRDRLA